MTYGWALFAGSCAILSVAAATIGNGYGCAGFLVAFCAYATLAIEARR